MNNDTFICNEGKIAFILPFSYNQSTKKRKNFWDECFGEYKQEFNDNSTLRKEYYLNGKSKLIQRLNKESYIFKDAECNCNLCNKNQYDGKFLCEIHSISNKFHDDVSQEKKQITISLGHYYKSFENIEKKRFDFIIDAILIIDNENHYGYLIFNINLNSFKNKGLFSNKEYKSDAIIFLKHLFYKKRLKVQTTNPYNPNCNGIAIQEWTAKYFKSLMNALGIVHPFINNKYIAFDYSIIELNNIKNSDKKCISIEDIEHVKNKYINQLYGLLVSDEGWNYVPTLHLRRKFHDNYFSTRKHTCTFVIGYNALIINQSDDTYVRPYKEYAVKWFEKYMQEEKDFNYCSYFTISSCIPGLENHIFQVFINSIYKNKILEQTIKLQNKNDKSIQQLEKTLSQLTDALETHSLYLGEIKDVENYIHKEFGINEKIRKIQGNYQHKNNKLKTRYDEQQNNSVRTLTYATIIITLCVAIFSAYTPYDISWEKFTDLTYIIIAIVLLTLVVLFDYRDFISKGLHKFATWFKTTFKNKD